MFAPIILAAICLAGSTVLTAYVKPYYDVENAENLFDDHLKEHKKSYNRAEYYERLEVFKETLRDINRRNAMFPDTVFALNHFADLKPHERQQYFGFQLPNENVTRVAFPNGPLPAPDKFDWRDKHVVSYVKDQGICGSCYIFSAVGDIEGQYALKHGQCLAFSEAQALECLDHGSCYGGQMHKIFNELLSKKKKLEEEADYPYDAKNGTKGECHEDVSKGVVQVTKSLVLKIDNEEELKNKLVNLGPLAVALNAKDFPYYKSGILEPHLCKQDKRPNHGVVLVGYGEENGKKYWLIKNSWGVEWGEKGYVKLLRGVDACRMGTSYTAHSEVA